MTQTLTITEPHKIEDVLSRVDIELRAKGLRKAIGKGTNLVRNAARQRAPIGDPDHHPERRPLRKAIVTKIQRFPDGAFLGMVGGQRPEGSHAHLVDEGHEIVISRGPDKGKRTGEVTYPERFFKAAIDTTSPSVEAAVIKSLQDDIKKAGG